MQSVFLKGLSAGVLLGAVAMPALAADLPQPSEPPVVYDDVSVQQGNAFDWSGFYAGGHLGWAGAKFQNKPAPKSSHNGLTGGVHAGYNAQVTSNVVLGVEGDVQLQNTKKTVNAAGVSITNDSGWNSTLRGRMGVTFDRFMAYGTGGLAIADLDTKVNGVRKEAVAVGWTAGAGIEAAVTDNVTTRLEYSYQDYGTKKYTVGGNQYKTDLNQNIVRAGMSYKF